MNRLLLLASVAVLGLAACGPQVRKSDDVNENTSEALRTISKLDCPQKQGELELVSAAPDGQSCAYKAGSAEVNLRLLALDGDAATVLAPIEAELKGVVPPPAKATPAEGEKGSDWNEEDTAGEGKAEIDFPGLQIKADDGGANIRIGNIHIDADEKGGAQIKVGGQTTVNANEGGAEIRTGTTSGEVRSTYILASEAAPNGYHVAGYEARGPSGGPIVVATVKAREESRSRHDLFDDLKDLVERQVGE